MITELELKNYNNYKVDSCHNIDSCGYTTNYSYVGNGQWEAWYYSTADTKMCQYCGRFIYEEQCSCGEKIEYITSEELVNKIVDYDKLAKKCGEDKFHIGWSATDTSDFDWTRYDDINNLISDILVQ